MFSNGPLMWHMPNLAGLTTTRVAQDALARLNPSAAARLASSAAAASAAAADTEDDAMGLATSSFAFGPSIPAAGDSKVRRKTLQVCLSKFHQNLKGCL